MKEIKPTTIGRNVLIFVCLAAAIFLAAGVVLGLWSAGEMKEQVGRQFNEEQLLIARQVSGLVQRELRLVRKEILLLGTEISAEAFDPESKGKDVQRSLSRVLDKGIWKIEICDLDNQDTFLYTPHKHWSKKGTTDTRRDILSSVRRFNGKGVWISQPRVRSSGIGLVLAALIPGDQTRLLLFHMNLSWFLTPILKDIRSGKTGYAWVIDEKGIFLFHPDADFVGKSAFLARKVKYPGVSHGKIDFIQKEKMLKGREGLGWYFSGWHRGITGQSKKLIAYGPIFISDAPPQRWSVAVVAPVSEIEEAVHRGYLRQFLLQGLIIVVIVLGAWTILFFEMRWSRVLEEKVQQRTEQLKISEEKYRSLVESAEDFIFTVDSEGIFQSMNSFTANFFGGHPGDFLGKDLSRIFPDEVAEKQLKLVGTVCKFGKSVRDEFEMEVGEQPLWISANFMPLRNEEGRVTAVLCIARDITENKTLERQLISTEKLASIGTLAAGVAHEINNPLGVMLGFCDILIRKTDRGSRDYEDLRTIERQGLHCKQVVENLLSFARFGKEKSEYSELNQCLEEIIQVVKHTLEMNHIELVLHLADNVPMVKGDSRQLQQVFMNLINNAAAAMPEGGALTIRTGLERGSRKAIVEFQDNGIGISEEYMDRIFEPFVTTKQEGEGTGLGLFVSYGIITKYGGTISCISHVSDSPGKPRGTKFIIKLRTEVGER